MSADLGKIIDALEDLKSDEIKRRLAAISQLGNIARAFGPDKTRQLIVPFLKEYEEEDEEILLELSNQLIQVARLLPEKDASLPELISHYPIFLNYEDNSVTSEGLRSLEAIVREFNVKHDCLILLAKKLMATGTPKGAISASRLVCRLAAYIPTKHNNEVVKILTDNASHRLINVRTETAIALREILLEGGFYEFAALTALKRLVKDSQGTVQVFAFETLCWKGHSKQYFQASLFPLVLSCIEVKNWRIRFVMVRQLTNILGSLDPKSRKSVTALFSKCLNDAEQEVSVLAVETLKAALPFIDLDDLVEKILPELTKMTTSESPEVKMALAGTIPSLAPALVKVPDAFAQVKSIITALSKDPSPDIKARLMVNIEPYLKTVNAQTTNLAFIGIVYELMADKNWKVRVQGLKALEVLAIKFPEDFGQDDKVLKTFNDKLTDRISSVRRHSILCLKGIGVAQGSAWIEKNFLPIIHAYIDHQTYLFRFNFLFGIAEVFKTLSPTVQTKEADLVVKMTRDAVPNIRFQALLVLLQFGQLLDDKNMEERVRKTADAMVSDADGEVRRLAKIIASTKDLKSIVEREPEFGN
jgi:serine/threonine-protein phosphatase 2A regulatory subunit A